MTTLHEAMFYRKEKGKVICELCPHRCVIKDGKKGICGARKNIGGKLISLSYGRVVAEHADPIEKKPFFNFAPGSYAYSIASIGCNMRCKHCQNWEISQKREGYESLKYKSPEDIVKSAKNAKCNGLSYTYTEPTVFYEMAYDTAVISNKEQMYNTLVTNGYINEEALKKILPYIDAVNMDMKASNQKFYREICGAENYEILWKNIKKIFKNTHIELTTLIIPTLNDKKTEIEQIAERIIEISKEIPWHITAFYPHYRLLHLPPTDREALITLRETALNMGLNYVYTGNIFFEEGETTFCPECGNAVIKRAGFEIVKFEVENGRCKFCGKHLNIRGLEWSPYY